MKKAKVALLTIAESREEFYEKRRALVESECRSFKKYFASEFSIMESTPIKTMADCLEWADRTVNEGCDAVVIHIPVWASPNLATKIACNVQTPIALLGNLRPDSSSLGGLLAAAGGMGQIGRSVRRITGDMGDRNLQRQVTAFVEAARAVRGLRRSNYCVFGGRSLGIVTTQADFSAWANRFGVECDHRDQLEIVSRAEAMDPARTQKYLSWFQNHMGQISFGGRFTPESLRRQINSYLALKDMVEENGYDFVSVKCQQEMSDGYAIQCVAISLLNDIYDADGPKKAVPCACEGDNDGALTMKILSLVSGDMPASLMDIRLVRPEEKELVIANCGGAPTWFAGRAEDPAENLKNIHMLEHTFGEAGGGVIQYVAARGPVTLARMFRENGVYKMGMAEGRYVEKDREELRKTSYCYPHGFFKADMDFEKFIQTIGANHMHAAPGYHKEALKEFCRLMEIEVIDYNL